jgi:predicted nuclease of predicted toxin-antitoxin system
VKLLIDSCLSSRDAQELRDAGHDVVWAGDWSRDPGDPEILRRAFDQSRVLVTLDSDFAQLLYERRVLHAGIVWLRNVSPENYVERTVRALETFCLELQVGGLVVVRKSKIRLRPIRPCNA